MTVFKSIWRWIRREAVLSAAILLAVVSAFLVPPDSAYLGYVDYRTLAILFCLMAVMAGLQRLGIFDRLAQELLSRVKRRSSMVLILWGLCFFFSMLITNDVSLITFVPFTMVVLRRIGGETERKLLVPVVVMQTVAANLGSMLTPIGNPQNLYLYGSSGMSAVSFLRLMLPYTLLSLGMLAVWNVLLCRKHRGNAVIDLPEKKPLGSRKKLIAYLVLFALCLLTVAHLLPFSVTLAVVLAYLLLCDRSVFRSVDYSLLLTFAGFFVFIGNMGRIPAFCDFLAGIIGGRELLTAVLSSQIISNVPAALLLSGFTENTPALIVGTNLGGLGTLIASMASLISFKAVAREKKQQVGTYLLCFTLANLLFLAVLLGLAVMLGAI